MSELGEVLGAVLAGLAHARRIADEESAAIAEYYRNTPLLEGMSLPRVRVPEMVVELPVLIEAYDEGEASVPASKKETAAKARLQLQKSAQVKGVKLPKSVLDRFDRQVQLELAKAPTLGEAKTHSNERTVKAVDQAFLAVMRTDPVNRFTVEQQTVIRADLRSLAQATPPRKPGRRPSLKVDVMTSAVKDKSEAGNVARLRVTLKEEGLEWTVVEQPDGTERRSLTPE